MFNTFIAVGKKWFHFLKKYILISNEIYPHKKYITCCIKPCTVTCQSEKNKENHWYDELNNDCVKRH